MTTFLEEALCRALITRKSQLLGLPSGTILHELPEAVWWVLKEADGGDVRYEQITRKYNAKLKFPLRVTFLPDMPIANVDIARIEDLDNNGQPQRAYLERIWRSQGAVAPLVEGKL